MSGSKTVAVVLQSSGEVLVASARWCEGPVCRLFGLQLRRGLGSGEGLLLVHPREGTLGSSIHMFFVFFPIAAVWINAQRIVTSAQLARPWRPYYVSPVPARYVLEADPDLLQRVKAGDLVEFRPPDGI
ncbi:MAG TPA: DUF192 domain-containing protein [Anaerolineales bacterium]